MASPAPVQTDPLEDLPSISKKLLLIVTLLSITYVINNLIERAHLPVPEAIITVCIGIFAGAIVVFLPDDFGTRDILNFEDQSALQFMLVFIAPIIFAEGYGMKSKMFFDNLTRILFHAFLGTVISTIIVGVVVYYFVPMTSSLTITMAECLAFGAMISATDPVTTLAIFKQQGLVEKGLSHLYFSVLGESILNDAVGITLFDGFGEFVKNGEDITPEGIAKMAGMFCVTFIGSMLVGIVCGMFTALVLKFARMGAADEDEDHAHFNLAEVLLMLGMSYIPFLIASALSGDPLHLSGIVAILFTGITSRHYAHYNLSAQTRDIFLPIVELLAINCETYTFLLVGMGFFVQNGKYSPALIGFTILACLVGRAVQVYPISAAMNGLSKAKKFTLKEMHISFFAGLRGAIAFMCALGFPNPTNRPFIISTTMVIVFVSMITLGWPTAWFLKVLRIGELPPPVDDVALQDKEEAEKAKEPLHGGSVEGTSRVARTLGGTSLGFLDKGVMQLIMTQRAIQERSEARNMAYQRHEDVEESVQAQKNGESVSSRRQSFQERPGSQPPSYTPGQQPPSYTPGLPPSYTPGQQPPSYTPGSQPASYTPGASPFHRAGTNSFNRTKSQNLGRVNP